MYTKQSNIVDHPLYLVYRKEGIALTHENITSNNERGCNQQL